MRVRASMAGVCLVALMGTGALLIAPSAYAQAVLTVGNGTSGSCTGQYSTISQAVAAAASGDTIDVCPGTYAETVDVSIADLTFDGAQTGDNPVTTSPPSADQSVVASEDGGFVLSSAADDTAINGFTIEDAGISGSNDDGIEAFQGSTGLTVEDNIIQGNNNGMNMQNPDGSSPAYIEDNVFASNDQGGNYLTNPGTGTGVFISNGPADNTLISANSFSFDSQTAINFAGSSSNYSTGLVVSDNKSTNDSTFLVATNSTNALVDGNIITSSVSAPGGFGDAILDFGSNTGLRISNNTITATGASSTNQQAGVRISTYSGTPSDSTTVSSNKVKGYYFGVYVESGYTSTYITSNKIKKSVEAGIYLGSGTSGNVITHNKVAGSPSPAVDCQDQSTGNLSDGTANTWSSDIGKNGNSSPAGICTV